MNIEQSEVIQQKMKKKDEEIQNLYKLIDQYSESNKMVEKLSMQLEQKNEVYSKKDEEIK